MKMKYVLYVCAASFLILLGAYVLIFHGGKLKIGNFIEIESGKNQPMQPSSKKSEESGKSVQEATVDGSGNAVNADNGASVRIER